MPTLLKKTLAVLLASVIFQCLAFSLANSAALAADVSTEVLDGYPPMPDFLYFPQNGNVDPIFIAAQKITSTDGEINKSILPQDLAESIESMIENAERLLISNPDQCLEVSSTAELDAFSNWSNLESATIGAENIIVTTITGRSPGFLGALPGTLLRFAVEEDLKTPSPTQEFIFLPMGDLSVGGARLCSRPVANVSLPEIGDRLVIFLEKSWYNDFAPLLDTKGFKNIIIIRHGGGAVLPERFLRSDHEITGKSSEDVLAHIRSILAQNKDHLDQK